MKSLLTILVLICLFSYGENFQLLSKVPKLRNPLNISMRKNSTFSVSAKSNQSASIDSDVVCYPPLDCFNKTYYEESSLTGRTGYFTPQNPENLNITILHFANLTTRGDDYRYNDTSLRNYNFGENVYFIIHGWRSSFSFDSWTDELKDTLLKLNSGKANVFAIDWSQIASSILYPVSAANTKLVGRAIGYFITNTLVKNYKLDCDKIHVIGHSLGGQTAGFVGKYTKSKGCTIKRITALDAAGPFFRSLDKNERVNGDDALYVDAIHSNEASTVLAGYGTMLRSGKVDLYPNGGSTQTGCDLRDQIADIIKDGIDIDKPSCSHSRAPQLFAVDYDKVSSCQLVSYQCKDYSSYKKGACGSCGKDGSKCRLIGLSKNYEPTKIPAPKSQDNFYISTMSESPYCFHTYQIILQTGPLITKRAIGDFYLNIYGQKRDVEDLKFDGPNTGLEANQTYTMLYERENSLGKLQRAQIYFSESALGAVTTIASKTKVTIAKIEINYLSHIHQNHRLNLSGVLKANASALEPISNDSKVRSSYTVIVKSSN